MMKNLFTIVFILIVSTNSAFCDAISETRKQEILQILKHDCGSCHGMTLKGGLGPSLLPKDLKRMSEKQIVLTITLGRPGTPMPPWEPFFNNEETHWLAQQLLNGVTFSKTSLKPLNNTSNNENNHQ